MATAPTAGAGLDDALTPIRTAKPSPTAVVQPEATVPSVTKAAPNGIHKWCLALFIAVVMVLWLVLVAAYDFWGRVADNWPAALTMVAGSFFAGSTPAGGGAAAFPVFTKVLDIPATVARSFTLAIQAAGMTAASLSILCRQVPVLSRVVWLCSPVGIAGMFTGLYAFADPGLPFWESKYDPATSKVLFTVILASMAFVLGSLLHTGTAGFTDSIEAWNWRVVVALVVASFLGGIITSFSGTGVNVTVFLVTVVLCDVSPKVAIPTTILIMTASSLVGIVALGLVDGHFDMDVNAAGYATSVGGEVYAEPMAAHLVDLLGMWAAAVPVVTLGAPLGAFVISHLKEEHVISFVLVLAFADVASTFVLLDAMHSSMTLMSLAVGGILGSFVLVLLARRYRYRIMGRTPPGAPPPPHVQAV